MSEGYNNSTRRKFLTQTVTATAGLSFGTQHVIAAVRDTLNIEEHDTSDQPGIITGFNWTIRDIGGAGITIGLLNLLSRNFPKYKISSFGGSEDLRTYTKGKFPECEIFEYFVKGDLFKQALSRVREDFGGALPELSMGKIDYALNDFPQHFIDVLNENSPEFLKAFSESKLFIYTSGMMLNYGELTLSGMNFWGDTMAFSMPLLLARKLGVPYGIYAQSFTAFEDPPAVHFFKTILEDASFVTCRDGDSVKYVKSLNINPPGLKFVPDSTVSFGLRDDEWGEKFMAKKGLKPKEFLIIIPRTWGRPSILTKFIGEERSKRHAHRLQVIIRNWVRNTGMKVLIAGEVEYQVPLNKEAVYDALPEDIKPHCELLDEFWMAEQSTSIFHNARIIVHMDFHTFFLAIPEGTPCVALMTRESGRKIWSYRDFNLEEYMFDVDTTATSTIENAIYYIHENYEQESNRIKNDVIPHLRAIENKQLKEIGAVLGKA